MIRDFSLGASITLQPRWATRDVIDLSAALDTSTFQGTTAYEAFSQGYVYLVQHGTPGEVGFGTTVYLDRNGSADDYGYQNDVALVDVQGVAARELSTGYGYYQGNFIV